MKNISLLQINTIFLYLFYILQLQMSNSRQVSNSYLDFKRIQIVNSLKIKLPIVFIIVGYFMFSDIVFRNNINAFYTRLIPIFLALLLTLFHISTNAFIVKKVILYNILLSSLILMMYGKCLVHLNDHLNSSITGTVLILFLITLELRSCFISILLVYLIPTFIFTVILFSVYFPTKEQLIEMTNIIPIIIFGIISNIIQNNFRFKNFEKQYLLEEEQNKTNKLYNKSLVQNKILQQQKQAMEAQTQELIENKLTLENSNNAKDKFISIISHDLKNPFNSIIGFSDLLLHEIDDKHLENIKQYSNIINSSAKQTYNLFENLLNWAILQNNENKLNFAEADILQLTSHTITFLEPSFIAKNIKYKFTSVEKCIANVDSIAISTAIRNLISNAVKYTHEGGLIIIDLKKQSNNISLYISDNGIGMQEEILEKLFKINSNVQTTGTANEKGTGLGLILCHEIIKQHNGYINVKSTIGKGSTFSIHIPAI